GHLPPPFPTHALPHTLRHYVEALSQALAVSPHVGAMLSLAVIAAAVAKNLEIRAAATWMEPVNLYVLIALPPASRKSSAFSRAMAPLRLFERGEAVRVSQEIATQGNVRRIKELHLARLQEKLASLDPAEQ